jgi:hypothetical protein
LVNTSTEFLDNGKKGIAFFELGFLARETRENAMAAKDTK